MNGNYSKIKFEEHFDGQVYRIILSSPKGNVLDSVMMGEISNVFSRARENRHLKIMVFEGEGKHFCFGASVEEHRKERAPAMLEQFHGLFYSMIDLGVPTASIVRGQCLGGGMELAIYCDFVFAESTAVFGQPEIKLGVLPPPASIILPLKAGQRCADRLVLTGESIYAKTALELGIATFLIPEGKEGWEFVKDWLRDNIIPKSASSLRYARACERMYFHDAIKKFLPMIQEMYLKKLMESHDANEGINAFLEKRPPVFEDK